MAVGLGDGAPGFARWRHRGVNGMARRVIIESLVGAFLRAVMTVNPGPTDDQWLRPKSPTAFRGASRPARRAVARPGKQPLRRPRRDATEGYPGCLDTPRPRRADCVAEVTVMACRPVPARKARCAGLRRERQPESPRACAERTIRGARVIQVVCVKQVPDTETRVKVAADGRSLDPAGVTWVLNPYDEYAVEQALRVRDQQGGGELVAVSVGGAGVQSALRNVLALGADRAVHLRTDVTAPDPLSLARALAAEVRGLGAGLVWFGKQAVDDDQAQVGPMTAELLGLPCATVAAAFVLEGEKATVEHEIEGGREVVELTLPAVITAEKGLNEPRYASLRGIMAAKKKTVEEKPAELGEPSLEVVALELPPPRAAGRIVGQGPEAVAELVRVLREDAKVI